MRNEGIPLQQDGAAFLTARFQRQLQLALAQKAITSILPRFKSHGLWNMTYLRAKVMHYISLKCRI